MYINDLVFDNGLAYVQANGVRVHILSSDIAGTLGSLAAATEGFDTITCAAPAAPTVGNGRMSATAAITAGTITNGTSVSVTHWALTTTGDAALLASGALTAPQTVTNGNTFTLDSIEIIIRDAA